MDPRTLVIGARGAIGRHVAAGLAGAGIPLRLSARRPDAGWAPHGAEIVAADLADPATLPAALDGVDRVFLYAAAGTEAGFLDAARAAGIRRVVLLSSGSTLLPHLAGNAIAEEHRATEELFRASGLDVAFVRPLVLAGNALWWSESIRERDEIELYRPDAVHAPVAERDVAAVAVAALLDGHDADDHGGDDASGAGALLTGPALLDQAAQVAAIARAVGRPIAVRSLDRADADARFAQWMPPAEAAAVLDLLDDAAAGGSPATSAVRDVLGRDPLGVDAWAAEHAAAFRR